MDSAAFEAARLATELASNAVEDAAIALATLEEDLTVAKDGLAVFEAELRLGEPLLEKNAEGREAEMLVRLRGNERWIRGQTELRRRRALVETARAALERARFRRQESLWVMRFLSGQSAGSVEDQ